ncbi:MAG: tetratricopeptide repeat protein [Acidimicrobiales bacterium]
MRTTVPAIPPAGVARSRVRVEVPQGLVELPSVAPPADPVDALLAVAEVPEEQRFCPHCAKPVGRPRGSRPGRTEGFCPYCRNHFSFTPGLTAGDVLADRYEVTGVLAHRGAGWVFLASDRSSGDRWVVLNGVVDAVTDEAAAAAVAEREFLTTVDHPVVVGVVDLVAHNGAAYVVAEYLGGESLRSILDERQAANGGELDPLPLDVAIACVLGVLPALAHFHKEGLAYGELRPDGIVVTGDSLRLIDLSGVRRIDGAGDRASTGPSVSSDLYGVGQTLAALTLRVGGSDGAYLDRLPQAIEEPLLAVHESLHRFLLKAMAPESADRFMSAEDMAEQLVGVLREEVAVDGAARPGVSTVFGPDGLAARIGDHDGAPAADWRSLPRPTVMPDDPGAGFLLGLAEADSDAVVATISSALMTRTVPSSTETLLRLARAQLDVGLPEHAASTLDSLTDAGGWRLWWHRGLLALASGKVADAVNWFDPVYTELPGEVPPKLALALAHETAGDLVRSAELYDHATRADPSYVSGAFGLARVRLGQGDREGAVEALRRVPAASSAHVDAEIAALRALTAAGDGAATPPSPDQLSRASAIFEHLEVPPRRRAALTIEVFEAGLATLKHLAGTGGDVSGDAGRVLDQPLDGRSLRRGLEAAYRQAARHAATDQERIELIDRANRARSRTLV